jgi:hypothetical protein
VKLSKDQTREGLEAAIRAAKLALFVIRKNGVMPNSSWEAGFDRDMKTAETAMAAIRLFDTGEKRDAENG